MKMASAVVVLFVLEGATKAAIKALPKFEYAKSR